MSRTKVYGKAYPITQKDAKAYRRVDRSLRPNPIGVTAMSAVNGRGAFRSARAVAAGKTRSQRIARAEQVYRNGERPMAGLLKNRKSSARKSTKSTTRKTTRRKVPGTNYFRTSGGRYQNSKGKFVKAATVKSSKSPTKKTTKRRKPAAKRTTTRTTARKTTARKPTTRRRVKRNASVGYSASYSKGYSKLKRSEAGKKAARTRKRRERAAAAATAPATTTRRRRKPASRKSTAKIGRYTRARVKDPRTGKTKLSYMTRTKSGRLRRIPTKAITKSGHKSAAGIKRGRTKAAARIKREGSAFVANKGSARRRRAGRRLAAYSAARRAGKTVKQSKASALRKVPLAKGDQFKGSARAPVTVSRRTTSKSTKVRRNKKRKSTTRRKTTALVANRRRKRVTPVKANRRRRVKRNSMVSSNRRRKTVRRNRRRTTRRASYRKNAFMANLKNAMKTGLFVTSGFLAHKVLTNLISNQLTMEQLNTPEMAGWKKPLVGLGVLAVGIPLAGAVAKKNAIEIGAGMVASFLHSVLVSAMSGQPEVLSAIGSYSNSRAYALRGTRRRGRRGMRGLERHATSIGPRYTPVRGFQQAAAGQFQQAAAGQYQQAAAGARTLGEYFTATQGVGEYFAATGEYFAPNGMKGVGGYEPAGQLAMQASAGTHQVIRDGVRPDGDLDRALDLAEAAAGLGEVPTEHRVAQQSQWIPNGPLWAGETKVTASQATSEISAGILSRQGGNGILSGG